MGSTITIDIVIPVLNEGKYLQACLDSVLAFEKSTNVQTTVYVVDGGSEDQTRAIAAEYAAKHPEIQVLDNPGRIQSCALNMAIQRGTGDYFLRLDAHAKYPPDYLRRCMESAQASGADNVGGIFKTLPGGDTYWARVVQAVTTHRFGVGNAEFRLLPEPGPADTVPYGFFKRSVFDKVGMFDERMVRDQDYELNRRILASGGKIWLDPAIVVHYYNQATIHGFLSKQLTKEGPYNAYLWYLAPYARAYRHCITGVFAAGVIGGALLSPFSAIIAWPYFAVLAIYAILATASATQQAIRYRCVWHVLALPPVFFLFHFCHGLGVLWGAANLATRTAPVQRIREPWPGAGSYRAWPRVAPTPGT